MTRIAIIEKDKCNPNSCNWLCFGLCPVNRTKKECITKQNKAQIDEELCTGCGICVKRCPFHAIQVINLPEKLKEQPIHRYGMNSFELFRLPIIKQGKVIGIIGRNGIGKSTAIQIMAHQIIPNLGNYKNPPSQEEIIDQYSTTYLKDFFTKLFQGNIKIAYKPQRIELLPKILKGKVIDLLTKIDERNIVEKLIKELDLEEIRDRTIDQLSGGELQRVAIIATLIKKADVYFFDEPTSFLDITHRIKIAKLINKLGKNKTIIVIEHDLATLDYISDEIQIIYGAPAAYGIISQTKSVKRGINEYLDGYLPDDNVRFRKHPITFHKSQELKTVSSKILQEIPELEKSFTSFKLKTNKGKIYKSEVLGIIGANGLGKSTFLNLLAKEIKPDKGEVNDIKISYKPQYLKPEDITVYNYLKSAEDFNSGWFKQNILEKLNINKLLNNNLKTLSGGELQKVQIAKCLAQEAQIYALDEPSAFVDVEDRLNIAQIIRDFVSKKERAAIVVDHDIQFIDYLADSILIFEGIPSKEGHVFGPVKKQEGMNRILKNLNITYRKDEQTQRPRINKPGSQLDNKQRKSGNYYAI